VRVTVLVGSILTVSIPPSMLHEYSIIGAASSARVLPDASRVVDSPPAA